MTREMPKYLSHALARELADELECAVANVREAFRRKHDAELKGLEHEISLALARSAVRYGVDLLPTSSAQAIDRLEVAVAELEAKLAIAKIAADAKPIILNERQIREEFATPRGFVRPTLEDKCAEAALVIDRERFLGVDKLACNAIALIEIVGAGSLEHVALTELKHYVDDRTVEEFEAAAREYFAEVGLNVRSYILENKTASFHVGSGK